MFFTRYCIAVVVLFLSVMGVRAQSNKFVHFIRRPGGVLHIGILNALL